MRQHHHKPRRHPHRALSDSESLHFDKSTGKQLCLVPATASASLYPPSVSRFPSTASRYLSHFSSPSTPLPDDDGQQIGPYILIRQVGHGGFSVVKEAVTAEGERVAVKIVRKYSDAERHFARELAVHTRLAHAHILPLLAVFDTPFATFAVLRLSRQGSLHDRLRTSAVPNDDAKRYTRQLAAALAYLHCDARVVHRDVKLENCLLGEGDNLLLCDFGMAQSIDSSSTNGSELADRIAGGSLPYAAPEQIESPLPLRSPAVDVWALGVVLYALVTRRLPFSHAFLPKLQLLILRGDWDKSLVAASPAAALVSSCLCQTPEERPEIRAVLRDPWMDVG